MIQAHGLRTSQGCGRPRHVSAPEPCAPRHTPRRRDAANSLSSSTVPPLAFLRAGARVSSTEPRPHQDCDKPDKPCRRHRRETPVYRIKIKRSHSAGAANTVQHLSSPETRRCFPPTMARTIAMLRPLCFAKWDKIFYLSGQQWPRDAALVTERDEKPVGREFVRALRSPRRHHQARVFERREPSING